MTEKEILESLLQGKKLKSKNWKEGEYICLNKKGNLTDEKGNLHSLYVLEPDFEEYVEYTDFFTAMKHIANGGKTKRKGWINYISLEDTNCFTYPFIGIGKFYIDGKNNEIPLVFYKEDILSKDWILL